MVRLLDPKLQQLAIDLVKNGRVIYTGDAEKDILKWNYSKEELQRNFETGILIEGKEIYNNKPEYHDRNYCISCYLKKGPFHLFGRFYNIIAWNFTDDLKNLVLFIHTSPCGGYEKRIYKEVKKIK